MENPPTPAAPRKRRSSRRSPDEPTDTHSESRQRALDQWMIKRFDETGGWTPERLQQLSLVVGADTWTRWLFTYAETERRAAHQAGSPPPQTPQGATERALASWHATGGMTDQRALQVRYVFGEKRWREWLGEGRANRIDAALKDGTLSYR